MLSFSDYIVFADESGDHSLEVVDRTYPVFVLALCLFEKPHYADAVAPAVLKFKFRFFGHDQVILHEQEIRKSKGPFKILLNTAIREPFYEGLNQLMERSAFTLFASVIRKAQLKQQYEVPDNPYHIALGFCLERVYRHLYDLGCREGTLHMLFERRGKKEDQELELEFRRVCDGQNALKERFPFEIILADKQCNSAGLQVADLVARPIGIRTLNPAQPNRAYRILREKFRRGPDGEVEGWGLATHP